MTRRRPLRRVAQSGLAAVVLVVGALAAVYLWSPVGALDLLDRWWPGGDAAVRVAEGVAFAPGTDDRLDIWATPAPPTTRRPVLIFFYGGSWVNGRRQDYGFAGRAYAGRGFVTVIPDYRKVPTVRFPAFLRDGAAAVRWVHDNIARYGGDPGRIVLAGHSAGAYIATMLALDGRYLRAERLAPDTIRAVAGLAGPYDFYPFTWPEAAAAMGQAPDPRQTQPVHFVHRDAPPLWLATGTADTLIAPRNTTALATRQARTGARVVQVRRYEGLGHPGIVMALSRPFCALAPVLEDSSRFLHEQTAN